MGYVTYGRTELQHVMSEIRDLDAARDALVREATIRQVMAESGEDRPTVVDMMDAMGSMDQESVLELTQGEPTTLADALRRYVDTLGAGDPDPERIADELTALLNYPWPGVLDAEALTWEIHKTYVRLAPRFDVTVTVWDELEDYQRGLAMAVVNDLMARGVLSKRSDVPNASLELDDSEDERRLTIRVGGVEVTTVNHDEHGWAGMDAARTAAEGVHRAVLAAVRAAP